MISLAGNIPVSISKASIILFAQDYIRNTRSPEIELKLLRIKVDLSNFNLDNIRMFSSNNKMTCCIVGNVPCALKSRFLNKQIQVSGEIIIELAGLEYSLTKQIESINIQFASLKFQGISSFLSNSLLKSANNAIKQVVDYHYPTINKFVLELFKKSYPIGFNLANNAFNPFFIIENFTIKCLVEDSNFVKLNLWSEASIIDTELSNQTPQFFTKKNSSEHTISIGISQDMIATILSDYMQDYSIPILNKKLPLKLQFVNIVNQCIELGISIVEFMKSDFKIELSISTDNQNVKLNLISIKPDQSETLLQLGIAKAVKFGIKRLLDEIGELPVAEIKNKIREQLNQTYHFNINNVDIKLDIPDFEIVKIWSQDYAICINIKSLEEFSIDL